MRLTHVDIPYKGRYAVVAGQKRCDRTKICLTPSTLSPLSLPIDHVTATLSESTMAMPSTPRRKPHRFEACRSMVSHRADRHCLSLCHTRFSGADCDRDYGVEDIEIFQATVCGRCRTGLIFVQGLDPDYTDNNVLEGRPRELSTSTAFWNRQKGFTIKESRLLKFWFIVRKNLLHVSCFMLGVAESAVPRTRQSEWG